MYEIVTSQRVKILVAKKTGGVAALGGRTCEVQ